MTKRIFKNGKWTVEEDPIAKTDGRIDAPVAMLHEEQEPPLDMSQLPFKKILNNKLVIHIDPYTRPKGQRVHAPDVAKRSPTKGTVVAIAQGILDIEVGDKILYSQYAGYLLRFAGLPLFRVIGYEEVISVLNENTPEISMEGA